MTEPKMIESERPISAWAELGESIYELKRVIGQIILQKFPGLIKYVEEPDTFCMHCGAENCQIVEPVDFDELLEPDA